MEKNLAYYLSLPYTIELIPESQGGWFVGIKELPGCMTDADTEEEALKEIHELQREWLTIALEEGLTIPEPRSEEEYSGNFRLRLPKSLHRKLVEIAEAEGISLNTLCSTALAEAAGVSQHPEKSGPESQPALGFEEAVRRLCVAVGESGLGSDVEFTFAEWFQKELDDSLVAHRAGKTREAQNILSLMVNLFRRGGSSSPFLQVLAEYLEKMGQAWEPSVVQPRAEQAAVGLDSIVNEVFEETIIRRRKVRERPVSRLSAEIAQSQADLAEKLFQHPVAKPRSG